MFTGRTRAKLLSALCSEYAGVSICFHSGQRHHLSISFDVGMLLCSAAALILLPNAQPDVELYSTSPSTVSIQVRSLEVIMHPC